MSALTAALWASITRTLVPIIVGAVIGWLTTSGMSLDSELEATLTAVLTAVFGGAYYIVVRLLETYVAPRFGWLLGLAKTPAKYEYDGKHVDISK